MKKILIIFIVIFALIGVIFQSTHKSSTSKVVVKTNGNYVALGDSVSAGVGLEYYSDSSACDRTNQSYPNLVSSSLNLKLSNISCSGATLTSGILGKQDVNKLAVSAQLNQLFNLPRPKLITLTIGANDIGWTNIISNCYLSTCGSDIDTATVNAKLSSMMDNLTTTLTNIQNNYKNNVPNVIVTGYHQIFPVSNSSNCSDLNGINSDELAWGRNQQENLNSDIQNVVTHFSFAKFAAVNFNGHELCSSDSWVQGLNANAPYHPNFAGQQEYANQINTVYKTFK